MEKQNLKVRMRIWLESETGETLFGEGQITILEAIEREGSINAAAKSLGMGYRSMWGRLKKIEERIGTPLLIRRKGGVSGGQSVLTAEAKLMVEKFRELQQDLNRAAEKIYDQIYP
ncbi:MAG: LysR family transcriptional regulator [Desulfobacteraceae bacterium]|nr:LysR family transcriptional regulator [Desulfobacteraceae bacterium]